MDTPGIEVRPITDMTTNRHFCEVFFTDVRVPVANLVGVEGAAFKQTMAQLEHERGGIDRLVSNRALYEMAAARADRSDPIVRQTMARLETGYRLGRILVTREVLRQAPAGFSAATKCFCTEHEIDVAEFVFEVFGADGHAVDRRHPRARLRPRLHDHGRHLERDAQHPRRARVGAPTCRQRLSPPRFDIDGATHRRAALARRPRPVARRRSSPSTASPPTPGRGIRSPMQLPARSTSWRSTCAAADGSWTQPGPVGLRQHADDVAAVIEQTRRAGRGGRASMGTYVALLLAERHPAARAVARARRRRHGAVPARSARRDDGTVTPKDEFIDEVLDVSLGPVIERLGKVWPDRASYQAMWAQHPAFVDGIGPDLERNLLADLTETDGGFRMMVDPAAVRLNGRELFADDEVRTALDRHPEPATIDPRRVRTDGHSPAADRRRHDRPVPAAPLDPRRRAQPLHRHEQHRGATMVADEIRRAVALL